MTGVQTCALPICSPTDYDLDDPNPFREKREDRYWEHALKRQSDGYKEDDYDGDWDD